MAGYTAQTIYTYKAAGAIGANHFVKLTANDTVAICVAGDNSIGITKGSSAAAGELIEVVITGGAKLQVDGIYAIMTNLKSSATGTGVSGVAAADRVLCMLMEASTAANDIVEVKLVNYIM